MNVSGASEPATRLFSALCALTAIGLLWRHARAFGPIYLVCAVSLFASSKLLIFYANETRGYALTVLGSASSAAGPVLVLAIVVAMGLAQAGRRSPVARDAALAALAVRMGAASLLLLATVALIDLHTPMSTVRNVIVLLPPLTVLGACSVKVLAQSRPRLQWALMLGLSGVCSLSIWTAAQAIGSKSLPRQDWKGAVAALAPHAGTRALHVGTYGLIVDHYFRQHGLDAAHARPWKAGQTALSGPAALIYGHLDSQQYARLLTDMRALGARRIHPAQEPQDGFAPGVYLID